MATAVAAKPTGVTEDDEEWLYGDSGNKEPAAPGTGSEEKLPPPTDAAENTENSKPKGENDDDDDDSDDEDNVQVTIGEISAFPVTSTGSNLFKPSGTYQKQPVTAGSGQKGAVTTQATKGVDVDGEGTVNGIPLYEFSLDTLRDEDKPWRKPGADITDYFNYGFNEDTWRKYCQKQNKTRGENGVAIPKAFGSVGFGTTVKIESTDSHSGQTYAAKTYTPSIQQPTAIAVLGSTTASRRPIEESMNDVQQIGTLSSDTSKSSDVPPVLPPVGMPPPDYSVPPPGMPPMPPGFSPAVPPPGMNVPPPNMFGHPPPIPPPFFPPNVPPPNSTAYPDRPPYTYDNTPSANSYSESKSNWDRDRESYRDRDRDRYDYKRDRSPGSGFSSDSGDDYRYSRSSKDYSRDYERDYYRSRESERSRSDRDRSRSRDRDRRHRDRDRDRDDKKSKRKIKDEPDDSDYYKSSSSSSKHKKSKRSKRDKDDESDKQTDDGKGAP